jgi:hypothetical protein
MSNSIEGFTALQQDLADRLWQLDTDLEVAAFIMSLPRNLKREAHVVMNMIIATELDNQMEVSPDVQAYLSSL